MKLKAMKKINLPGFNLRKIRLFKWQCKLYLYSYDENFEYKALIQIKFDKLKDYYNVMIDNEKLNIIYSLKSNFYYIR